MTRTETNLFAPFKALGVICSSVPPAWAPPVSTRAHFHDGYVLCALDNVVVAYGLGRRLQLAFSTDVLDDGTITLLAADAHRHYVCFANKTLVAVIRNRTIERRLFVDGGPPKLLLSLTDSLVVVDSSNSIHLFDVHTGQPLVRLDSTASFDITAIVHPINYLNKILVGAADGRMRLWNLCSGRLVHEFPVSDTFNASITVLEQSPAVDVIGVGLADGRILLRNIKFDKLICTFRHGCAQITALAFRTDGVDKMVSANAEGLLAVWDLNERQLLVQLSTAHSAKITWLHFVLGQPYLISAGEDNRIVKWFFRSEVALPEIDTALEGHSEPVTALRFCAEHLVVSAGRDGHVRRFNTGTGEKSGGSVHFGLAREVKKGDLSKDRFMDVLLNPIVQIELSHGREAVWDNMICRHEESPLVSTWSTRRGTRGSHLLCHERFSKNAKLLHAMVTSLCISCCGTFAILGHSTGHVDVWNMQSGRWKYELQRSEQEGDGAKKNRKKRQQHALPAHDGAVTGLALDLTNRHLVTGSDDGTIQFWHFRSPQQQQQSSVPALGSRLQVQDAVQLFRLDAHNSLLAVGLRGGEVGVLDILCRRIARRFFHSSCIDWPQNARLTGLDFSSDGKWLVSADNLGFLKVWDLVTGSLIDVMRCAAPCVGLAFSERNDFLATCHEGQRGVYLWANKAMFLASHSMSARPEHELHSAATAAITALPATAPVVGEDPQQEVEEEVEAVVQGHRAHDNSEDQRSQAEEEDELENRVANEEEMKQDERETRAILIDEEEEEEDGVASLSTLSLEVGAELPERLQLDPSLYTLSGLAPARWAGLPHLEHIRRRNKPTEPPKKPKAAPFFLPTVGTINSFAFDKEVVDELKKGGNNNNNETADDGMEGTSSTMEQAQLEDGDERAILKGKRRTTTDQQQQQLRSQWTRRLMSATTDDNLRAVFAELREMSVSALDLQLRCLSGTAELVQFVAMLAAQMECRRDFDLAQSLLAAFLNIHHGTLWSTSNNNGVQLQQQLKSSNDEDVEMASSNSGTRTAETTAAAVAEGVQDDANVLNNCRLTEQLDRLHKLQQQAHNTLAQLFDDNTAMTEFVKGAFA
uniref:Small-subunit processome Utp21 domain-containing protein n=1 Tax=Globodera rostochiensis TaxID=31243 RepID=A0A914I9A7_GLORO